VLAGTLLTHLGGGSAGREGTAVQMGASLARSLGKLPISRLRLTRSRQRLLLMAGVAGGFGSLFGTPVAGAIFGLEVIEVGRIRYEGMTICLAASFVGDGFCRLLGTGHFHYHPAALPLGLGLGLKLLAFAVPVALVAGGFAWASHTLARWTRARLGHPCLRAFLGGLAVIALAGALGSTQFLNLGTPWLSRVFAGDPVPSWAFLAKLAFTAVTLGFGFKGGEVTPLFVMGALLGASLAPALALPAPYLAAVGLVGVFAAASNTPLASTFMGIELFGAPFAPAILLTSSVAYLLVGHWGIYGQRVHTPK
jgi:H+/Cl- antiporter ClcA